MEKSAHYFIVGLFVSLSLMALMGFLIWLQGPHDETKYDYYTIYFTDSVNGLKDGAVVEYKGVKAGKVVKMRLTPDRSELVKVDIGVTRGVPIRAETKASLEMQGVTGLVRLELATDPGDKKPPAHLKDEQYPVLYGTGSQFFKALQDLPVMTDRITSVTDEVKGTAKSMRSFSDKLQDDPSQILYQPSENGVEIPR